MGLTFENKSGITKVCNETSEPIKSEVKTYSELKNIGSIALASDGAKGIEYVATKKILPYASKNYFRETSFSSLILNGKEAKSIFNASGLAEKGIKLKNIAYKNFKYTAISQFRKNGKSWNIWGKLKARGIDQAKNLTSIGLGSYYLPKEKTIIFVQE